MLALLCLIYFMRETGTAALETRVYIGDLI